MTIFILYLMLAIQILGCGFAIAKMGEAKTGTYKGSDVICNMIVCLLFGLAIYYY